MKAQQRIQGLAGQLGGLPVTAKLLLVALMVILVLLLVLVALFTGRPPMAPLSVSPEARTATLAHLQASGVPYQEADGQILVPAGQQHAILARLTDQEVITGDQIDFDSLIENDSPFLSREQQRTRKLIAKMNVLSNLVSRFRGVRQAQVVIDEPKRQGFGATHVDPTASVHVVPAGELGKSQIEAIAHLVAGAHAGLEARNVQVVNAVSGTVHHADGEDELAPSRYLEHKQRAERHVKKTLTEALAYIPNVSIAVNAMLDTRRQEQRIDRIDEPRIGPVAESSEQITATDVTRAQEPGIRPNAGASVASPGGRSSQLNETRSEAKLDPRFPTDRRHITDPRGYPLKINASIGVPRSYFVHLFQVETGDPTAQPDDPTLQPTVDTEIARIRAGVEPLIDTEAFEDAIAGMVYVRMIPDVGPGPAGMEAGAGEPAAAGIVAAPGGGGGLLRDIGLGALVLISLLLMLLMVRKASAQADLPSAAEVAGAPPLPGDISDVVGEAEEPVPAPEGIELDDTSLRRRQMVEQVSEMVRKDPDEVANLLRRWIRVEA